MLGKASGTPFVPRRQPAGFSGPVLKVSWTHQAEFSLLCWNKPPPLPPSVPSSFSRRVPTTRCCCCCCCRPATGGVLSRSKDKPCADPTLPFPSQRRLWVKKDNTKPGVQAATCICCPDGSRPRHFLIWHRKLLLFKPKERVVTVHTEKHWERRSLRVCFSFDGKINLNLITR